MYTVKKLSKLANVSVRTLHYYDEIDLLNPASIGDNGYRYYDEEALFRLQQILFFKELDFSLEEIHAIIDSPDFDTLHALREHKTALQQKVTRLGSLIHTVDQTILHLEGQIEMRQKDMFEGFTEEKQKQYEDQARERYGHKAVDDSMAKWNHYTKAEKDKIRHEGEAIYLDMAGAMNKGSAGPDVQAIVKRWHEHMRYFYEPSVEGLRGLADLYNDDPQFRETFTRIHPQLPEFLREAIRHYCDSLK